MTSEERREGRYQRRKAKRESKLQECKDFYEVFKYEHLYSAYKRSCNGIRWKRSVKNYRKKATVFVYRSFRMLLEGQYKSMELIQFDLFERGKQRHISSVPFPDRVVQKCLCEYSLDPVVCGSFVYDNGASQKNKGYHFSIDRIVRHLHWHYHKYGREGYILLFDFKKFFESVSHDTVRSILWKRFYDKRFRDLFDEFLKRYGPVGLGLGSQISQTLALASASPLDHYVKEQLHIRCYGRYMDDGYLIHYSKEYLESCLKLIDAMCQILGITLNKSKTQIVRLTHGFTFLKCRFFLTESGRVVKKICKQSITRMRRKLKKFKRFLDEGVMSREEIHNAFQSWLGYASHFDSYHTVNHMKKLYHDLYHEEEYLYKIDHYKEQNSYYDLAA